MQIAKYMFFAFMFFFFPFKKKKEKPEISLGRGVFSSSRYNIFKVPLVLLCAHFSPSHVALLFLAWNIEHCSMSFD
jgi:hypothetical protein